MSPIVEQPVAYKQEKLKRNQMSTNASYYQENSTSKTIQSRRCKNK